MYRNKEEGFEITPTDSGAGTKTISADGGVSITESKENKAVKDTLYGIDKSKKATANKLKTLYGALNSGMLKAQKEDKSLLTDYEKRLKEIQTKTVKNGTVYSSIGKSASLNAEQEYVKKKANVSAEYAELYDKVASEIALLAADKDEALVSYNLELAAEIEERMARLNAVKRRAYEGINKN